MKAENKQVGKQGEDAVAEYLCRKGYRVIERNYSTRYGEIDLICSDKNTLVFIEVKTKTNLDWGLPEEMFTRQKYRKVKRMGEIYLSGKEMLCRIDMVAVTLDEERNVRTIQHYENVTL